jgi:hypothetical protein
LLRQWIAPIPCQQDHLSLCIVKRLGVFQNRDWMSVVDRNNRLSAARVRCIVRGIHSANFVTDLHQI